MAISKEDVLEYISNLSVLELSELVKEFEEKFGVSAAPVMVAGGAGAGGSGLRTVPGTWVGPGTWAGSWACWAAAGWAGAPGVLRAGLRTTVSWSSGGRAEAPGPCAPWAGAC